MANDEYTKILRQITNKLTGDWDRDRVFLNRMGTEIRCQAVILAQKDESTPDYARGKPTIVSSVFHGAEPCIRAPNRLAVSVTQFGSPKGRHMILDSRFWIAD